MQSSRLYDALTSGSGGSAHSSKAHACFQGHKNRVAADQSAVACVGRGHGKCAPPVEARQGVNTFGAASPPETSNKPFRRYIRPTITSRHYITALSQAKGPADTCVTSKVFEHSHDRERAFAFSSRADLGDGPDMPHPGIRPTSGTQKRSGWYSQAQAPLKRRRGRGARKAPQAPSRGIQPWPHRLVRCTGGASKRPERRHCRRRRCKAWHCRGAVKAPVDSSQAPRPCCASPQPEVPALGTFALLPIANASPFASRAARALKPCP